MFLFLFVTGFLFNSEFWIILSNSCRIRTFFLVSRSGVPFAVSEIRIPSFAHKYYYSRSYCPLLRKIIAVLTEPLRGTTYPGYFVPTIKSHACMKIYLFPYRAFLHFRYPESQQSVNEKGYHMVPKESIVKTTFS